VTTGACGCQRELRQITLQDKQTFKTKPMYVHLNKPYKVVGYKQKRYDAHYHIPSAESLVVPTRNFGDEVLCDVRWEDDNGELKVLHEKMFMNDNLIQLNPMLDEKLFEIWEHYYNRAKVS
jgi:hypothetical protein